MSIILFLGFSTFSFAEDSHFTCMIKTVIHSLEGSGVTSYRTPMTLDECRTKAITQFNAKVSNGNLIINPFKNIVIEHQWTTQYKFVKMTYLENDGSEKVETFKRDHVIKSPKVKTIHFVKSGFRCWTKGECDYINE